MSKAGVGGESSAVAWTEAPVAVHPERIKLLQGTVAKGASEDEVLRLVELATRYDLDPLAGEVSLIRGRGKDGEEGAATLMVRRDGLRKIADRNGLRIDGDVVRQRDEFKITRNGDRSRSIEHTYSETAPGATESGEAKEGTVESSRGPIVGAWAECWEEESGTQRGWFFAPLSEYKPTDEKTLLETPWGTQESALILSAAERQSVRQATPLSGMVVEGEMDLNHERQAGLPAADPAARDVIERAMREVVSEEWAQKLLPLVLRVNELAPNTWLPSAIQMQFGGQDDETLERWCVELKGAIETLEVAAEAEEGKEIERLHGEARRLAREIEATPQGERAGLEEEAHRVREQLEALGASSDAA